VITQANRRCCHESLKEDVNIKAINFTVNIDDQFAIYQARGQNAGNNAMSGAAASEQESL
jgi:hypothetical protein